MSARTLCLLLVVLLNPAWPIWASSADASVSDAATLFREWGRGINLGNALEAPKEGDWGVTLQDDYFAAIEKAGFTTVRVPIRWSAHASRQAPYTIDPAFLARVDWVVTEARTHNLRAILDFHNYDELVKDPAANKDRFLGIWKQIAEHYQSQPSTICFELFNEPNGKLDAATWNSLLAQALGIVRATNPDRLVVVGPVAWNGIRALPDLVLPESDRRLVVTVHYYDPMQFTHQGASWIPGSTPWLGTKWLGTDAEKAAVDHSMDLARAWGQNHQRPMFLGEFGAFSNGDMESRARWTSYVARSAEANEMPWAYWEFCSGFGAYDPVANQWRAPLLNALMPGAKK